MKVLLSQCTLDIILNYFWCFWRFCRQLLTPRARSPSSQRNGIIPTLSPGLYLGAPSFDFISKDSKRISLIETWMRPPNKFALTFMRQATTIGTGDLLLSSLFELHSWFHSIGRQTKGYAWAADGSRGCNGDKAWSIYFYKWLRSGWAEWELTALCMYIWAQLLLFCWLHTYIFALICDHFLNTN